MPSTARPRALELAVFGAVAAGLCALILLTRGVSYWNFSDGVYAYTAQAVLNGGDLYTGLAAAQPPPIYYAGAAILAVADSHEGLRVGLALAHIATGLLVLIAVRRLTGRPWLAVAAGLFALLTPRALHDFANLLPETLVAPLVIGAALAASRTRSSQAAGAAAALAAAVKLPYALPAVAIAFAAADRRRYVTGLLATGAGLAALFLALFGSALLEGVLTAQGGSGLASASFVGSELLLAGWNLLPLAVPAALGWHLRSRAAEPALLRATAAAALGSVAVFVTIVKHGAYINLAVVAEPPLLVLGACGIAWALESRPRLRAGLAAALACAALGVAQAASLILSPSSPRVFARPFDPSDHGWIASPEQVERELSRTAGCPPERAYSGAPFLAFMADRRMPGDQGDVFIIETAENAEFRERADRDQPRCPQPPVWR